MVSSQKYLSKVIISLPIIDSDFKGKFISFFEKVGKVHENAIKLNSSNNAYQPKMLIEFSSQKESTVKFIFNDNQSFEVDIVNSALKEWKSPFSYTYLSIEQVLQRISPDDVNNLDHIGFNLPWPKGETHPELLSLRNMLKNTCLYHLFPSGENWDFILPGTIEEISGIKEIEYQQDRKPKFEIVSFENSSKPLVQFDMKVEKSYEALVELFPEAIHDENSNNIWIYLQNSAGIDICLVLNRKSDHADWSQYFKNHLLH